MDRVIIFLADHQSNNITSEYVKGDLFIYNSPKVLLAQISHLYSIAHMSVQGKPATNTKPWHVPPTQRQQFKFANVQPLILPIARTSPLANLLGHRILH